jgi:hypothetical protein
MSNATTTAPEGSESEVLPAAGLPAEGDAKRAWAQALEEVLTREVHLEVGDPGGH